MGTRIVLQLDPSEEAGSGTVEELTATLTTLGAEHVKLKSYVPDIVTAVLPEEIDIENALKELRAIDGVVDADVDAWRYAL